MLEMLSSINYVKNPRPRRVRKSAEAKEQDTTEYVLSSEANAESLRRSIAQLRRGEVVQVEIAD
jgi:PHD/YefM family antitoxin component YafN of YafNO toxin-antitoxin module